MLYHSAYAQTVVAYIALNVVHNSLSGLAYGKSARDDTCKTEADA
jgi:hypothetical protein